MYVDCPQVLMIDDNAKVADAYALRLRDVAETTVAHGGESAIDIIGEQHTPDVVLLDRHMPGMSGDEVLSRIRDREIHTKVIMVTAIDPGLSILDMPFDDYLSKPVDRDDLHTAVDQQCQVLAYELLGEYFRLESKRVLIETEFSANNPDGNDQLAEITEQLSTVEQRVRELLPDADRLLSAFSDVSRGGH
jgi:Response regulator containing CheY-like receiver, AAA-type ATPase, and DNA-binding domains